MMNACSNCGAPKRSNVLICPSCQRPDEYASTAMTRGAPALPLLILLIVVFWIYRFWRIGWIAWSGNLRLVAWLALGAGVAALVSGALWSFGIRSRKQGALVTLIAIALLTILQFA